MTDVASEAGVSVGVLYQRFKDKQAFFEVIVDTLAERIEREVNALFDDANNAWSLREIIEVVVASIIELVDRDVGFFMALITVGDDVPAAMNRIAETDRLRATRFLAYCRERELIDGRVDEEQIYFALATVIRMLLVTAKVDRDPIRLHGPDTLSELTTLLNGYLSPQ